MLSHAAKVEVVESYVSAYNARDADRVLALYAAQATMEDPVGTPPAEGPDAIRALYRAGFDMGITVALDGRIRSAGDSVIFPLCATSESGKLYIIDLFEFDDDGKIARMRAYWSHDNLEGEMDI